MTHATPVRSSGCGATATYRVERFIAADAQAIFDVLADPFRHHEFDGSGMVQGEPHGPGRLGPGVRFTMAQRLGRIPYRSINDVVAFEEGRLIAWATSSEFRGRKVAGGQIWRYELEPIEGGTLVREVYDLSAVPMLDRLQERLGRTEGYVRAMEATLGRLADLVTAR